MSAEDAPGLTKNEIKLPVQFTTNRNGLLLRVAEFSGKLETAIRSKNIQNSKHDLAQIAGALQELKAQYEKLGIVSNPNIKVEEIEISSPLIIDREDEILSVREFQIKLAYAVISGNFGLVEACLQTAKEKLEEIKT